MSTGPVPMSSPLISHDLLDMSTDSFGDDKVLDEERSEWKVSNRFTIFKLIYRYQSHLLTRLISIKDSSAEEIALAPFNHEGVPPQTKIRRMTKSNYNKEPIHQFESRNVKGQSSTRKLHLCCSNQLNIGLSSSLEKI